MEAVDGELQKVAKAQDLVFDVLRLVAQSMCFSEAQKNSLEAGPVRQKVEMMLSSADFAPYRQAALSVEAVKRRVEMVQKERAEAASTKAEQLKREREKKRQARPNRKRTPIQEAADRLEVDEDMLRAVAAAMTMSEAQVDAACQADPTAGEKLRGVREGVAFGEIREACVKLGLVDEASKEMKAALKEDEDTLDDSQLDAAERSMGMSADAVERLPDDAKRAVKALRSDPAFAGVRAAVEARRKRRAKGASASSKPKPTPKPASKPAPPKAAPPKPSPPKPTGGGNVAVVHDDDDNLDSAFAEAFGSAAGAADGADDDEGWSAPVAADADDDDDGGWSDPVAAEALEDLDLEDDDIDEEEPVANTPDHALQATESGYELTVALPPGARAKDLDCDGQRCRIVVPGHDDLVVRFAAPVDPRRTEAKFSRKTSQLKVAFRFPDQHASFMEDLGREAQKRGYVPPMSGLEEVNDGVRRASRGS